MERLLLIGDDESLGAPFARSLEGDGLRTEVVRDGARGLEVALAGAHAVVVLDATVPRAGGLDILRRLRTTSRVPVVLLTARDRDLDRVVGLELGADDCVAKPFDARELAARIRAVLRRATRPWTGDEYAVGDLEIVLRARRVLRGGEPVALTSVEFDLLDALARVAGRVVPREELSRNVLGRNLGPLDRGIDKHASNLRRKLGPLPDGFERVKSVRGIGYFLAR